MAPAEPDTMKTAMVKAQQLTAMTGQEWTIFTNDQQLYKIAVHVSWVDNALFEKFIPRLGGMHLLMSFVGAVGHLMAGSGLEDILKSAFAGVPKLLSGKNFPQNVRALRIVMEEILRPILINKQERLCSMSDVIDLLDECSQYSNTAKMWVDCLIKPVLCMMLFVRAEREGDWPLHLFAVKRMIPYFFAANHFNYAHYGLYYLRSMQQFPPAVLKSFMNGEHVSRHQDGIWNGTWSDLFIETTYMRYGHGPSGVIGSTLNYSTLAVWALSMSSLTQIGKDVEEMADGEIETIISHHKEECLPRINDDKVDRNKIGETISTCIDIFDIDEHPQTGIVNIHTGQVVDDPGLNVHNAVEIGTEQWWDFENQWPEGFHNKLKQKVKTVVAAIKPKTKLGDDLHIIDSEFIYARVMGIMASSRNSVSMETLFSHELAPHPTALFDDHGEMRTTNKSTLKNKIKIECGLRNLQFPKVVILDGCAILWTIRWPATLAKVSTFIHAVVSSIMKRTDTADIAHVVFDHYQKLSIKSSD